MSDLITAKHVDDIHITGSDGNIARYLKTVENIFGKCKISYNSFTNCGIRYNKNNHGDVEMDQDEYIATLRPVQSAELTGAPPDQLATKIVSDMFVSLRGALAYAVITQAWILVYVVALQRVQTPTNLEVRRLNAVTRKLQREPKKLIFRP